MCMRDLRGRRGEFLKADWMVVLSLDDTVYYEIHWNYPQSVYNINTQIDIINFNVPYFLHSRNCVINFIMTT